MKAKFVKIRCRGKLSLLFTVKIVGRYFGRAKKKFKIKKKHKF